MATGASTADAAVILIDAPKGVLLQSRRHAFIASLLRVRHIVVAVNKMDLAGFNEAVFRAVEREFSVLLDQIAAETGNPVEASFVPVSALAGDNVVHRSQSMPWYTGPSLLELLESVPASQDLRAAPFRFPVQRVLRPDQTFRGFAGQIASGTIRPGDAITVMPSGGTAKVERIVTWDGDLAEAYAPQSVTLALDRELDISRGDLIVSSHRPATLAKNLTAALVWMDQRPLEIGRRYLLKHTSQTVPVSVSSLEHRIDVATLQREPADTLEMNGIGHLKLSLLRPIAVDLYAQNRFTGALILIDPETNGTVAAGMITAAVDGSDASDESDGNVWGPVSAGERQARWGHRGGVLELSGPAALIDSIERSLFSAGVVTSRVPAGSEDFLLHPNAVKLATEALVQSGLLALVVRSNEGEGLTARVEGKELRLDAGEVNRAVSAVHQLLHSAGIFISFERANL